MIVLAIDTALDACSVAVVANGLSLATRSEPMARGHQERLAPMVAEAVAEAKLAFDRLERIAVTIGPGSFTGLRVGLAFAKALSLALDVACVGVGTLEALMASLDGADAAPLAIAALDARRDQLYLQVFSGGEPLTEPGNLSLDEAQALIVGLGATAKTTVVGSGAALLGYTTAGPETVDPVALARLAAARPMPQERPSPLYLRAPDARTIAERATAAARHG